MNIGKIVQVIGNVVDLEFPEGKLPEILSAVALSNPTINDEEDNLIVEVAQHLGDNVVRCVGMDTTDGLVRGMPCKDTGAPIQMPVGKPSLGRVLNVVGKPVDGPPRCTSSTTTGISVMMARARNSVLRAIPGPEVTVKATLPPYDAPRATPAAAISSSAW